MTEIVLIANLQAKPGRGSELLELFAELTTEVLATEPDTLRYALLVVPNSEPLKGMVIEKYASAEAVRAHERGALARYWSQMAELLSGDPEVVTLIPAQLPLEDQAEPWRAWI